MRRSSDREALDRTRRRILATIGGGTALGLAGCLGGDGDDGDGGTPTGTEAPGQAGVDPVEDRVQVDPADIQEGGTFRAALAEPVDTFDVPFSNAASASNIHGLLYEGMITTDSRGNIYPWLAESYERVDMQSLSPVDYEEYMITAEYGENGAPQTDNRIVISHPDNDPSSGEGQFLTTAEAAEAANDGTYGMHYRFQLHEGVSFHDGEEMTADNVIASYERVGMEGSLLSGQLYDSLLHIEADGDYTVDLYAQVPDADAIRELGGWEIYPTAVTDLGPQMNDPREGNTPMGTGPFVLEDYQAEEFTVLTKFDDYWFDTALKDWFDGPEEFPNAPVVDEVDISIVPDTSSRAGALDSGEIDVTRGLSANSLNNFRDAEGFRTARTAGAGFTFMQFPVTVEPWDDARLRRAVNHLIPRTQISDNIFQGWEDPAWIPLPPLTASIASTDYQQSVENLRSYNVYDPDQARSLADEVVDERGIETPIEVTIQTNANNDDRVSTVELIAESMNQLEHFDVTLDTLADIPTFIGQAYAPDYHEQGYLFFVGLSGGFSPHGFIKAIHHPDNFRQCCNVQDIDFPELNQQLENARYGTDVVEDTTLRQQRYEGIMETVLELNGNSYGTHSTTVSVVNDDVMGWNSYPSVQSLLPWGLHGPTDQQIAYLDRE